MVHRARYPSVFRAAAAAVVCGLAVTGCHLDMWQQARYEPYEASTFFTDGMSSRPPVEGAVPYQMARLDAHYYSGVIGQAEWGDFPGQIEVDRALLARGQERYMIYCMPCHGAVGNGDGKIVQRGFKAPETYHSDRLRGMPAGYFVDVITNGFATMYSYADRVKPEDRWAIAAYIRVLQYSQHAPLEDVPEPILRELRELEDDTQRVTAATTAKDAADHAH